MCLMESMNAISSIFYPILMSQENSLNWLFCQQFDCKHIGELEITQGQYHTCFPCSSPFLVTLGDKILARADCCPDLVNMFLPRVIKNPFFSAPYLSLSPAWVCVVHLKLCTGVRRCWFGMEVGSHHCVSYITYSV